MINESFGLVSLERFLSVERYRETQQAPSTHLGTGEPGRPSSRPSEAHWRSNGTSNKAG